MFVELVTVCGVACVRYPDEDGGFLVTKPLREQTDRDWRMVMAKQPKQPKAKKSPLDRAIEAKQRGIQRMEDNKRRIRQQAEADCVEIDKRIASHRVLLEALKRGALKP